MSVFEKFKEIGEWFVLGVFDLKWMYLGFYGYSEYIFDMY